MAHYAFKECCYDIDYPKFKELIAKFEQGLGSECDHDANYDGDYWLIAAMWINELRESEKSQAKRIAELEGLLMVERSWNERHRVRMMQIVELEAERDALKVDAAKQFQAGHAAGLEAAAVKVTKLRSAKVLEDVAAAIRAMKEQA